MIGLKNFNLPVTPLDTQYQKKIVVWHNDFYKK